MGSPATKLAANPELAEIDRDSTRDVERSVKPSHDEVMKPYRPNTSRRLACSSSERGDDITLIGFFWHCAMVKVKFPVL